MADLFEEYGALEYKKPKKKLKLPKLPVPPKWILWLGIAVVIIGAVALWYRPTKDTPPMLTEKEKAALALEKCEKALTEFQGRDSCYVRLKTGDPDALVQEYWRCDGDIYYIFTSNNALFQGYLQKGSKQYFYGSNQAWERTSLSEDDLKLGWLDSYRWNKDDITLLSQKTVGEREEITLQIAGAVDSGRQYQDMESYTVFMYLDKAGMLSSVTLSYTLKKSEETQTYQINAISREEVSKTIQTAYSDVVIQIAQRQNPILQKFRRALEEFRSLDGYCVERKQNSGGQILYGNSKIWRCGSDLLVLGTDTTDGYLCKNGDQFYLSPQREEGQRVWTAAKLPEELLVIPWLETYNWDSRDVISVSEDGHFVCIVFEGDSFDGANGDIERYSVVLTLDDSGALTAVDMAYLEADGGVHSSTFKIVSTDWTEIEKTIDKAYEEAAQYPESLVVCKDALDTFRNGGNWCVIRETALNGVIISRSQYWTCGRDSMMQVWDVKEFNAFCYLQKEGLQFKLEYSLLSSSFDPLQWELTAFPEGYFCIPWLENVPWDYHETELVREEVAADGKRITINIPQDPMGIAKDSMELCYELDQDGVLRSVTATYSTQNGTIVDTFQIASTDKEEIAQTIYEAYEEAVLQIKVG